MRGAHAEHDFRHWRLSLRRRRGPAARPSRFHWPGGRHPATGFVQDATIALGRRGGAQHEQPPLWIRMLELASAPGARALPPRLGADRMTRGAGSLHDGQATGSVHWAMGRTAVNDPQAGQA
jgi:hypothetical protein